MSDRPLARRAPLSRRALPCLLLTTALASAGCRGAGAFKISPISDAMTSETLLGCVAEVAAESGLPVIEQRADAPEPTLWARSDSLDAEVAAPRRIDVLTVSFKKLGRGLKVLAQTFDLRGVVRTSDARTGDARTGESRTSESRSSEPRVAAAPLARPAANTAGSGANQTADASANVGPSAASAAGDDGDDGTLWHATSPSLRVAEARDAVLARCGSLGP